MASLTLEVRLGGIYALERIARDSPRDRWTIMEVLTAYVRQNARWLPLDTGAAQDPRTDIQAILTVLGRRRVPPDWRDPEFLYLQGTDLRGLGLRGAQLDRAHLGHAHLEKADLRDAISSPRS
jgi:Pentapeptide repeats (8 copies)